MAVPPPRPRRHRIAALALALTAVVASTTTATTAEAAARTAPAPTLDALPGSVDSGARIAVTGTAPKGARVTLQLKRSTTWTTLGTSRATSTGAWRADLTFTSGGRIALRAVAGGKASRPRRLDVFQWLDLAAQPFVTRAKSSRVATAVIAGRTYRRSIILGNPTNQALAMWEVDRRCTDVRYAIGFLDAERSRATGKEVLGSQVTGLRPDGGVGLDGPAFAADWSRYRISPLSLPGLATSDRLLIDIRLLSDIGNLPPGLRSATAAASAPAFSLPIVSARVRCRVAALPRPSITRLPLAAPPHTS